ncbi:MAG: hypothetical protein ACRDRL_24995 [Sciscionella sp.]
MRQIPAWPLMVLGLPAAVSIWAGWVGLGGLTGFGVVELLPGIWNDARINTAITLPIGMEAYAAYALRAWLTRGTPVRARQFAKVSAICALALGTLGQIAYHLMVAARITVAPWLVTMLVSGLPVAVLGMGAALYHLLDDQPDSPPTGQPGELPDELPGELPEPAAQPSPTGQPEAPLIGSAGLPGPATRCGPRPTLIRPPRRRTRQKTDAAILATIRRLTRRNGIPPSQYVLRNQFGIGSSRATRLLTESTENKGGLIGDRPP